MKRTLIVATTSYAGMGPYVSEIVNNFSNKDDIYYFFRDNEDNFFRKNIKKELRSKSYFYKRKNSKLNKIIELLPIKQPYFSTILKLCCKYNIQVVHFINGPESRNLISSLEKKGITSISTIHDLHPHESKKKWYKELRSSILNKRLKENLNYIKNVITNSQSQFKEIISLFPKKKVFFHSFPTLVTEIIKCGNENSEELKNLNKPYILFFGRIEEYKGIGILYKTFVENSCLNKNFYLVIAGKGTLSFKRENNELNVIFINRYINDSEIANMYKNAACVVYPYISATQSGVLSLAFYFKVPILASDVSFFKDNIVPKENGLLFKNGDCNDLRDKLLYILNSDNCSMTTNGKEYYNRNYNGKAIREKLIEIYNHT